MNSNPLFTKIQLKDLTLNNRIVMAPMTRSRTQQPGDIPTSLMAEYYAQRASAGLIISEATQISAQGKGYSFTPGIYTQVQIQGWQQVTQAVKRQGGKIFCQLWHVGRMSHASLHADGITVAPSALAPDAKVWISDQTGNGTMRDCPVPKALSSEQINNIVADYVQAATNAIEAGFDGVEIHAANGYLIDQFLRRTSNHRTDQYGGRIENRTRFLTEVCEMVSQAIGAHRTGVRLAPFITQRGMDDDHAPEAILVAAEKLEKQQLAYIHLAEADWDHAPQVSDSFRHSLREIFSGKIMVAGNYTQSKAQDILTKNLADLVAFGRPFIANPDLPNRFKYHLPLSQIKDHVSLFGGDHQGYTDYPSYRSE